MAKIIKDFVAKSQKNQRPGHAMSPKYITVHNTANASEGANAEMHARYLHNGAGGRVVGWHFTVDDSDIYQHLPTNENGWHAGDGDSGKGNRQSIGIEICENADGDFKKATAIAQGLIADLMKEHGITIDKVVPHKHWSGKQCPRLLLGDWEGFKAGIGASKPAPSKPAPKPSKPKKKTIAQMAAEVSAGKHGNGHDARRKSLGISKAEYEKVRAEVNRKAGVSKPKPAPKPKPKPKPANIKAGSKVTLSKSAKKYATGENIPSRFKGGKFTIQQVSGNRALLKEIYSWVNISDIGGGTASPSKTSKSISQMATEVIAGKHGNGHDVRRKSLGISQAEYNKVRAEVNRKA